jgi:hypothetical protein
MLAANAANAGARAALEVLLLLWLLNLLLVVLLWIADSCGCSFLPSEMNSGIKNMRASSSSTCGEEGKNLG